MPRQYNFKSPSAYEKWLAYIHIHHLEHHHAKESEYPSVRIQGIKHKVKHKLLRM